MTAMAAAATLLASACGTTRLELYQGPPLPAASVAILQNHYEFFGLRVYIERVDRQAMPRPFGRYEIALLPGHHEVEIGFDGGVASSTAHAVVRFDARPGHRYEARVQDMHADSAWSALFGGRGRWTAVIVDLADERVVGPPPTATPAAVLAPALLRE